MQPSGLLLPTFLYGSYRDVKRACGKAAAQVVKGAPLAELPEHWFDVADLTGYILTQGPKSFGPLEPQSHYQGYALVEALIYAFDRGVRDPRWETVFEETLTRPWLIYSCLGQDSYHLFKSEDHARRFATAVRTQWETLNVPGRKFLFGSVVGFWSAAHTLGMCLGKLGAPVEEVISEKLDPAYQDGALPPVFERYTR